MDVSIVEIAHTDSVSLEAIGKLRYEVWKSEGSIEENMFPSGVWIDDMDSAPTARHWLAKAGDMVVACARLTVHGESDDYRDVKLWRERNIQLPFPVCDLGRLVVRADFRRRGIAARLNSVRVEAARTELGVKAIICTASKDNMNLLYRDHHFEQLGCEIVFPDRPETTFHAVHLIF